MQFRTRGNNLADKEAKSAALMKVSTLRIEEGEVQEYPPHPSPKEIEGYREDRRLAGRRYSNTNSRKGMDPRIPSKEGRAPGRDSRVESHLSTWGPETNFVSTK
ncbi:hypothetical protein DUI87_01860 [Hirundo rustica rustica]|uniref:Uncharacterized protein n=1 Tax=Hirundo rustica rustica TaxID=333673 RepID=A0A3M0LAU7_HIRRU|nr:hypothetical protein DUI87_01860 [Hirundo rustica rustica]